MIGAADIGLKFFVCQSGKKSKTGEWGIPCLQLGLLYL